MKNNIITLLSILTAITANGAGNIFVADSVSRHTLPSASVFDCNGNAIGMSDSRGRLPLIAKNSFPITIRYLGFEEKIIERFATDTVFLKEITTQLPEVYVESRRHKVLHILAYVREFSNLTTYTDTVFLFREKMVDYMMTPDKNVRFTGWHIPRILKSKSYYRFTNAAGLDSVSSKCDHHFSWSDWIGAVTPAKVPDAIMESENATDTLHGKYSPSEIWIRNKNNITVNIDVLADTASRKWVPNLSSFFQKQLDFENFKVIFKYENDVGDPINDTDLAGYSFSIESNGRGHDMFRFNHIDQPFFVSTFGEVYILDKEYVTVREAKKWVSKKLDTGNLEIIKPEEAPAIQAPVQKLIARVEAIDHNHVRTDIRPDHRLVGKRYGTQNIGQRALFLLKELVGITYYKSHRNFEKRWNRMKKDQLRTNKVNNDECE